MYIPDNITQSDIGNIVMLGYLNILFIIHYITFLHFLDFNKKIMNISLFVIGLLLIFISDLYFNLFVILYTLITIIKYQHFQ